MSDVFKEIKKIRWTEFKRLYTTSFLTIVIIVVSALVFLGYDAVLGKLIDLIY